MSVPALQIGTLRVRGAGEKFPAGHLRLSHLLNTADWHPAGLPPSAVLVVRRLADPLPGRLARAQHAVRVDAAWEMALRRALEALGRRAARPQQGLIPGAPEAVLFADEAEMLACLLLAHERGVAATAWWAKALGKMAASTAMLVTRLVQQPHLIPAVFGHLAHWRKAADILAPLPAGQTRALLNAVVEQYQLPGVLFPAGPPGGKPDAGMRPRPAQSRPATPGGSSPPWTGIAGGDVAATLSPEQQALLGLCLVLQARPALAFTTTFQQQWQDWRRNSQTPVSQPTAPPPGTKTAAPALRPPRRAVPDEHPAGVVPAAQGGPGAAPPANSQPSAADGQLAQAAEPDARQRNSAAPAGQKDSSPPETMARVLPPRSPARPGLTATASKDDSAAARPVIAPGADVGPPAGAAVPTVDDEAERYSWATNGVETSLGGVLYLLNLMRVLNLPASGEPGWGLAGQVGAWGVLELLGRALLGPAGASYAADPLWRVLAGLDGRPPDTLPGADYENEGDGSLPAGWREAAGSWSAAESPLLRGAHPELQRWLAFAVPTCRRRLQQALRLRTDADLADALLLVPGRVFITRSHVDLVMDLNAISLPVRRAGLDANPGWLPACGRVVTFHYR